MMLIDYTFAEEVAKYLTDSPVFSLALKEAIEDHKSLLSDILHCPGLKENMDSFFPVVTTHRLRITGSKEHMFIHINTSYNETSTEDDACSTFEMHIECADELKELKRVIGGMFNETK